MHHSMNTGFMPGGVDMETWLAFRGDGKAASAGFDRLGGAQPGFFQTPGVAWRNDIALFLGPRQAGLPAPGRAR